MAEGGRRQRGGPPREKGEPPQKGDDEGGGGGGGGGDGGVALKKEIGLLSACGIIVGNIIGSGIFVSPRGVLGAAGSVGAALLLWAAAGVATAMGALCYAELGVSLPHAGGDYAYVTHAFGGLAGFLRLWVAVLVIFPTNQAVIALTFANAALQPLFPSCAPPQTPLRLLAAACLLVLTWVNCASARWATRLQDGFTAGKLLALAIIIGTGVARACAGQHQWLAPPQAFSAWSPPSAGGVALAFLQGSFAYGGWNFLNYVTEELVEPRRNLPRAIAISIPLVTAVYVLANMAYVTAMSPQELLESNAVAVTFGEKALGAAAWVMPLAVALSTFGGVNGSLFTCSRLFYAGAREGHLPALLAMIHVERRTPIPALLLTCVSTLLMLVAGDVYTLINYVGFVNYMWYGVTVAALLALRRRQPHLPRPLRVPLWLPGLYLLLWAALLLFSLYSEPALCGSGAALTAAGAPLYLLGVRPRARPPALRRALDAMTRFGQQLCLVVYPAPAPHGDAADATHGAATHGDAADATHGDQEQPLTSQPHN